MKKIVSVMLAIALILSVVTVSYAAEDIRVFVNGQQLSMDVAPIIVNDRTMVPIRAICEALGCEVVWDEKTQVATISNGVTYINMKINSYYIKKTARYDTLQNREIEIDVPPIIYNNRTLVPVRAISECLFADIFWDSNNQTIKIELKYDWIDESWNYGHNIRGASKDGKCGFINENKEIVIPFIYDEIGSFGSSIADDGLARVKRNGKYGYVNTNGDEVVSVEYDILFLFQTGNSNTARFYKNGKNGHVNRQGKEVIPPIYNGIRYFSEGLCAAKKDMKWGFVNIMNENVIPFEYDNAIDFSEGLAAVRRDGKWGFIDYDNNVAIPFIYDDTGSFYKGAAGVTKDGVEMLIDYKGDICDSYDSYDEYPYVEGLARVENNDGFGFIDKSKQLVIPTIYDFALYFSEGLVMATINGVAYGFIDKAGNEVVPFIFDWGRSYSGGLAAVSFGGIWGYIDRNGAVAIPFEYDDATSFDNDGYAIVRKGDRCGIIDQQGTVVVPFTMEDKGFFGE